MPNVDAAFQADLLRRLHCAEGHLRGVAAMIERQEECENVLRQLQAVQGALRKIAGRLVQRHVSECLWLGRQAPSVEARERALAGLATLYVVVNAGPLLSSALNIADGQGKELA